MDTQTSAKKSAGAENETLKLVYKWVVDWRDTLGKDTLQ